MSNILVNAPCLWDVGEKQGQQSYIERLLKYAGRRENWFSAPFEHLGLMSIKSYCEARGVPVQVVNGLVLRHVSVEQTIAEIQTTAATYGAPTLLGFAGSNLVYEENMQIIRACRRLWPAAKTVYGGDFASLNYERLLSGGEVDFVSRGLFGEKLFAELALKVASGERPEELPGLASRASDGGLRCNPPESLSLSELPWVSRDDLKKLVALGFAASVYASRGCPYRCAFCTTGQSSSLHSQASYLLRPIEDVIDEISALKKDFGVDWVTIVDDLFLTSSESSRARATQFAEELLRRKTDIHFMFDARVDSIDTELFRLLQRAGLRRVFVGVETGSEEQLRAYNKKYGRRETASARLRSLVELGLEVIPGIITYHPAVTAKELRETLAVIDACGYEGTFQFLNRIIPYPGTPLFEQYRQNGWLTQGWPVADWNFQDQQARAVFEAAVQEAQRPNVTFEEVRAAFLRQLEVWSAPAGSAQ